MKAPKLVNVVELSCDHAEEIRLIESAIAGHGAASIWTTRMRPVLRGGKAWIGPMVVEDDDRNE
ncbi:MAG TPA: hypothetical protein VMT64_12845 [Candidatus Binataceae bacterium]|nr:hypothetical protein [Candidatus Binataceae bacterium]